MSSRLSLEDLGHTDTGHPVRRKMSGLGVVGVVLLMMGIGCLGWVGYQYLGTNLVSRHAYQQEKLALQSRWQQETRAGAADSGATAGGQPQPAAASGDAVALLRIPAFGPDYEVPILRGTDLDTLARGVGMYDSSAAPGQIGNFAIAGHRVTHGQPFAKLLELNKGAKIMVETQDAVWTYALDTAPRDLTVDEHDAWVLNPVPVKGMDAGTPLLTMTTCQDLFHSPDRSVAFGHLISTTNKH